MYGTHFSDSYSGRVFSQTCTPVGLAIPKFDATAIVGGMPIFNPPASGVVLELISISLAYVSGTAALSAIGLMARLSGQVGAASTITAFSDTVPKNGLFFGSTPSKVLSSNAGTVTVTPGAAADWHRTLGNINLEAATGTPHGTIVAHHSFDGSVLIPAGVLIYLAGSLNTVALYNTTIVWKEI